MNTRFATLVVASLTLTLTGCSSFEGFFGRGAPCGTACSPSAAPAYDVGPGQGGNCCEGGYGAGYNGYEGDYNGGYSVGGGCNCGDAGAGYANSSGVVHDGLHGGAYLDQGYYHQDNTVPAPGSRDYDGLQVMPQGSGTQTPMTQPTLPSPR